MNKNDFMNYEAPQVEVIEVEVEKGFAHRVVTIQDLTQQNIRFNEPNV